ncbi:MAG: alpha-L-fucosidase [Chitinophagaceae bacterium]
MRSRFLILLIFLPMLGWAQARNYDTTWASLDSRPVPDWFQNAKFGIFIHWGLYSVPAWAPKGVYAEWYQYWLQNKTCWGARPVDPLAIVHYHQLVYGPNFPYYRFANRFKAQDFNPDQWAQLFVASGAKYVVLTAKHHDGFCLWPSKEASRDFGRPWNSMVIGPHKDLVGELTQAIRKTPIHMGLYYSLYEWFDPLWTQKDYTQFVDTHMLPQLKDLVTRYHPDILWTDGEWSLSDTVWKSRSFLAWLFNDSPVKNSIAVNDRWGKGCRGFHGGYLTTEYNGGNISYSKPWEECRGMGYSFGYNSNEDIEDYNSAQGLVLMLVNIVSKGGNLLLDIGPEASGKIPPIMEERLLQIGKWLKINGEAIYGTRKWKIPVQWSKGKRNWKPSTSPRRSDEVLLKQTLDPDPGFARMEIFFTSKDKDVFGILPKLPEGTLSIWGITLSRNSQITLLGNGLHLNWRKAGNGIRVIFPSLSVNELPREYAYVLKMTHVLTH